MQICRKRRNRYGYLLIVGWKVENAWFCWYYWNCFSCLCFFLFNVGRLCSSFLFPGYLHCLISVSVHMFEIISDATIQFKPRFQSGSYHLTSRPQGYTSLSIPRCRVLNCEILALWYSEATPRSSISAVLIPQTPKTMTIVGKKGSWIQPAQAFGVNL